MAAYLIVTAQIHDRARFLSGYAPAAAALTERFGGEYVLRAPGAEVLEGEHPGGSVVVSRWPDRTAALAFWNSPEYAEARTLREGIADCQVLIVEAPAP
ncbi:MAG: DUF1330 domain-containing protein [Gammaproteobacteria bacterium]|nr:DUF1330 domain-containing protein [Gammaproteobacteria bacterium]MYB37378.1 DUF1330 domain-containing protein [Gammaproteobacteria bacterium]